MKAIWLAGSVAVLMAVSGAQAAGGRDKKLPEAYDAEKAKAEALKLRADLKQQADGGSSRAMAALGALMEQDDGTAPIDRAGALDLYEKAAAGGNAVGRRKMCQAYLLGDGRPRNVAKGMPVCNALGLKDPVGLFSAAYDYQKGLSGPADEGIAIGLYTDAVKIGSGDAAAALGHKALDLGKPEAARQWFRRGVYFGSADAMDSLAVMSEAGQGGPVDATEAAWLYYHAALRGNVHAATKVPAASAAPDIANISLIGDDKSTIAITRSYTSKSGPKTETLDYNRVVKLLSDHFPMAALREEAEGYATIECYVAADHSFDTCLMSQEFPLGMDYGLTLETLFNGHMVVADRDTKGEATEHRLLKMKVRWVLTGGTRNEM